MAGRSTGGRVASIGALSFTDIVVAYMLGIMQTYFTDDWKLSFTHAAGILNVWGGLYRILPILCLFLAESYLGHFTMLVLSSIAYSAGLCSITLSTPSFLGNVVCESNNCAVGHKTRVFLFSGLALVAVGMSGLKVSSQALTQEQKETKSQTFPITMFYLTGLVNFIGLFTVAKVKAGAVCFGVLSICMVVATIIFLSGWNSYDKKKPQGSPLTNVCRVYVACAANIFKPFPSDPNQLHTAESDQQERTPTLKFLEKAAIIDARPDNRARKSRWKFCSVGEVEDAKTAVRMIPIWMTCVVCGIVSSIGFTYFIEQASHMNRKVGKWEVPIQLFIFLCVPSTNIFLDEEDEEDEPSEEDGVWPAFKIVMGMIFAVLCCITAARIEKRRLNVIRTHGLLDKPDERIPMSIFWLVFQFSLLGSMEWLSKVGLVKFYKYNAPASLKDYFVLFTEGVFGLGHVCSMLSVYVVGRISEKGGKSPNWFQFTLNMSRLDRYYWVLSTLASVNLLIFIPLACRYRYQKPKKQNKEESDVPSLGS